MITHVRIQNFRSFVDAEVDLQPFSLVVGANGSGKSNFLRFLKVVSSSAPDRMCQAEGYEWVRHQNHPSAEVGTKITLATGDFFTLTNSPSAFGFAEGEWSEKSVPIFNLDSNQISEPEISVISPQVGETGSGTCQVLDSLKSGDREDLFKAIETNFRQHVPEVEKLSLKNVGDGVRQIQVRERGLKDPVPASGLSEGTRLILCILTILHQEIPPAIILLEDIDRGMHPRLFSMVAPLIRDIAERNEINIIATTQNPYLVDCFKDHKDAVIVVEKKEGASTLTTLTKKLERLNYDEVDPDDVPLGSL